MIALVTAATLPKLCEDDQPLLSALTDAGIAFTIATWDDATVDWADFDAVILRSPWDYTERPDEFLAWHEGVSQLSRVHNGPDLVRRSIHKRYLVELAAAGINVIPTVVVGTQHEAKRIANERAWELAVLKPSIGLGGRSMSLFRHDTELAQTPLRGKDSEWCVQPYVPSIRTEGEYSVVVINGAVQHALVKRPGANDFRVHDGRGGTHESHPVTDELAARAADVLHAFGASASLYARVDLVRDEGGHLAVMELDVISPCLYTEHNPDLAPAFATAVAQLGEPHR